MKMLDYEMKKTDDLLYRMIPKPVAKRLRKGEPAVNTCEVRATHIRQGRRIPLGIPGNCLGPRNCVGAPGPRGEPKKKKKCSGITALEADWFNLVLIKVWLHQRNN